MKINFKNILATTLLLTAFVQIFAQKAVLDTNSVLIGDQVALKLQVDIKKGLDIRFPLFDKMLIEGIEIVSQTLDTVNQGKTLEKILYITSFDDSLFSIPPIPIVRGLDTLKTNPLKLKVSYFKPDSAFLAAIDTNQTIRIRDIKPIMETPWTLKEFWQRFGNIILIVLFSALIVAAVIYYIIRRRKNKPIFFAPKPKLPPHLIALESLNKLKEEKLWQKGKIKEYYTELTEIVRVYIENRYSIPAMEYTSYQILDALAEIKDLSKENSLHLGKMLSTADLVKFAKLTPLEHENNDALKTAFDFVDITKQIVVETVEQESKIDS